LPIASYYVHNLLSGLGSVAKNIGSGLMNGAYFPARKVVAGLMGGGEAMSKEGWNTYKNMLASWSAMQEELSTITIGGRTLKEAVRELVTSPQYQMLPDGTDNEIKWSSQDDTKVNALNDLFRDYNDEAKERVINDCPQFTNNKGMTIQEAKEMLEVKKMDAILNQSLNGSAEKIRSLF